MEITFAELYEKINELTNFIKSLSISLNVAETLNGEGSVKMTTDQCSTAIGYLTEYKDFLNRLGKSASIEY